MFGRIIFGTDYLFRQVASILSRPEQSGGRIEGCGFAFNHRENVPFDTRSTAFHATQDAKLETRPQSEIRPSLDINLNPLMVCVIIYYLL